MSDDTPLPDDVIDMVRELNRQQTNWEKLGKAAIQGKAADMLERQQTAIRQLQNVNLANSDCIEELTQRIEELEEGHNAFNRAIAHALKLSSFDTYAFLYFWNEGDWDACCWYDFEYVKDRRGAE